jgi:hypothetical protein
VCSSQIDKGEKEKGKFIALVNSTNDLQLALRVVLIELTYQGFSPIFLFPDDFRSFTPFSTKTSGERFVASSSAAPSLTTETFRFCKLQSEIGEK